jgi:hypothetical protein
MASGTKAVTGHHKIHTSQSKVHHLPFCMAAWHMVMKMEKTTG